MSTQATEKPKFLHSHMHFPRQLRLHCNQVHWIRNEKGELLWQILETLHTQINDQLIHDEYNYTMCSNDITTQYDS